MITIIKWRAPWPLCSRACERELNREWQEDECQTILLHKQHIERLLKKSRSTLVQTLSYFNLINESNTPVQKTSYFMLTPKARLITEKIRKTSSVAIWADLIRNYTNHYAETTAHVRRMTRLVRTAARGRSDQSRHCTYSLDEHVFYWVLIWSVQSGYVCLFIAKRHIRTIWYISAKN